MSKISAWFSANKVVLLGLLGAIAVVLQQYMDVVTPNYMVIAFGLGIAVLSFLAKNLRGQWASITGILGTAIATIATTVQTGNKISWYQLIVSLLLAVIAVVAPPAKSLSYESSPAITEAKSQAVVIDANKVPPANPPVANP